MEPEKGTQPCLVSPAEKPGKKLPVLFYSSLFSTMGEIEINTVKIPHSRQEVFLQFCAVDRKVDFGTWIIKRTIMQFNRVFPPK